MQNHLTPKTRKIFVAIASPGWPLNRFPNGIVAYTHNLLIGLEPIAKTVLLAAPLIGQEVKNSLIDLSRLDSGNGLLRRLLDKILFSIKGSYVHKLQFHRNIERNADKILMAIEALTVPLDILEIEESFGTGNLVIKNTNVPVVTRLHGPWFLIGPILKAHHAWDFKLRVFYEGEAIRNSQGLTSPSLDVLNKVREYYGLELPHAQVIPNPVPEASSDKQWQCLSNQKTSILFVGRFDSVKGGDLVIDAFRQIALKNSELELLFVGPDRGILIDGKEVKFDDYVERFVTNADIKKRIQFLGHCDQERISDLRKTAIVTVVCSRYENFPLSLLESLAAGCPTVATAVGGMKEIIIDDYNGLLAESESPTSIAEKVLMLINDPEKMQRLSKNAIEDCKKRFSPEVVAAQTLEYYQSVLDRIASTTE